MRDMKSSPTDVKRLEHRLKEDSREISNGISAMISFVKDGSSCSLRRAFRLSPAHARARARALLKWM